MRGVIQRVDRADVEVEGRTVGEIGPGLLALLSVEKGDGSQDCDYLSRKILNLRIFNDQAGKMNRSVVDEHGQILVVSQFTLHGDCRKGNRPGFSAAELPQQARVLFEVTVQLLRDSGLQVHTGVFGADMAVSSVNAGPVTILLDSHRVF